MKPNWIILFCLFTGNAIAATTEWFYDKNGVCTDGLWCSTNPGNGQCCPIENVQSSAPNATKSGYTLRGWTTVKNTQDVSQNTGSLNGFVVLANDTLSDINLSSATDLYPAWAKNCTIPTNGSCKLTIGDDGSVTYATSCNDGYEISGGSTATPTCTPSAQSTERYRVVYIDNSALE